MVTSADRLARLLVTLDAAWNGFEQSYAGLSGTQMLESGVTGEWSVRDLVAHITWWEEEALKHVPVVLEGGRPPRYSVKYGGIDAFNALMTEQRRDLSLATVMRQFEETHQKLVAYVKALPPGHLVGDTRARRRLRLDTYGHYPIHTADIQRWRERRGV